MKQTITRIAKTKRREREVACLNTRLLRAVHVVYIPYWDIEAGEPRMSKRPGVMTDAAGTGGAHQTEKGHAVTPDLGLGLAEPSMTSDSVEESRTSRGSSKLVDTCAPPVNSRYLSSGFLQGKAPSSQRVRVEAEKPEELKPRAPKTGVKRQREESDNLGSGAPPSLPPIPNEFLDLYTSNSRVSVRDDPSLHEGRKRAVPHVEGNWATHVYLEWYPNNEEIKSLYDVIHQSEEKREKSSKVQSFLHSDLGAPLPLHISLSRPAILRTEQKQSFSDLLQDTLQDSDIRPFRITINGLDWVSNFENTRWFLVLRINKPKNNDLNRLLRISNQSLAVFEQPPLYDTVDQTQSREQSRGRGSGRGRGRGGNVREPVAAKPEDHTERFHISIAWSLTEPSAEENERIRNIALGGLQDVEIQFDSVKVKIGNHVLKLPLSTKALETKGFGGL
ncbi:poly(U)-specific 3'-to-5' RNA exonuclease [Arachnomyces sp. PD_36]|nr:poly(U)-specific 3'-to-5' RNA exonuclease [Arachnomyces sp. PD_36]